MKFSDIPGHEDVKTRLRQMADDNRIPHALLLEGPEGIGKHALARAFLQYVGCSNRRDGDSCGMCPSCRQHQAVQHIDTIYSFPYVKKRPSTLAADYMPEFLDFVRQDPYLDSNRWLEKLGMPNTPPLIYVEEANELIRRLSYASNISPYTAVVIWQIDRLNEAAANKLLKVIEEPPGQSIIVMTSDVPMNILPTIYSRTQRVKVKRLSDDEIAAWMVETGLLQPDEAAAIAPLAEGSLTRALQLADKRGQTDFFLDNFISLMRLAYKRDIAALKDWSQNLASEKRDTIVDFLEYTARMIRENFIANMHDASLNLMSPDETTFSTNFARFINERNVQDLFDATSDAINDIRANASPKLVLFDFAITVILKLKQ